jgi:hypothetical protein
MTFSGPSAAYKLNCSCYYFCYCFRRCFSPYTTRIDPAATARINLAATTCINPAATYYSPPYRGAARLWSYYYSPLYYRAARS